MAINHLSDGNPDGWLLGQSSTDKGGFFGLTTPIVRPSVTAVITTATTGTNETAVTRLYTVLVNLGLIVTS